MATRETKYPDTKTFHFYNANPKNRITGDCTERALCTALDISWEECVKGMMEVSIKTKYAYGCKEVIDKYLALHGFEKMKQPRKSDNTKYTGEDFCRAINAGRILKGYTGSIVAMIGSHHIVCIKKVEDLTTKDWKKIYKVCDIWNSTRNCIGNYWIKEETK